MELRKARREDLAAVTRLEALCFPPEEAASRERMADRLAAYPDCFWLLFEGERLAAMVNGMATDQKDLTDELYAHADLHEPGGTWQMIFGVATRPDCRRRGYAGRLLRQAIADSKARGRTGLVLTCKERLVPYYAGFGFVSEGLSVSAHGGAVWYQMRLTF